LFLVSFPFHFSALFTLFCPSQSLLQAIADMKCPANVYQNKQVSIIDAQHQIGTAELL